MVQLVIMLNRSTYSISLMPEYFTDSDLALQVAAAIENDDRTQQDLADELDVDRSAIAQAKQVDEQHPARLRQLRIRLLRHLMGADVAGPYFRVSLTDPTDS